MAKKLSKKLSKLSKAICHKPSVYAGFGVLPRGSNPPLAIKKVRKIAVLRTFFVLWLSKRLSILITKKNYKRKEMLLNGVSFLKISENKEK
jgi:hypothetical protein